MIAILDKTVAFVWHVETEEAVTDLCAFMDNVGHDYVVWRKP